VGPAATAPTDASTDTLPTPAAPGSSIASEDAADAQRLAEIGSYRSVRTPPAVAAPIRVEIPAIGVSSELQRLGRDRRGAIEIPDVWDTAGWYAEGARPGQAGPAVVLGHVDSRYGPAVFFRLRELAAGDRIVITRDDGSRVTFVVDRLERHAKTRFPTDEVYLSTLEPTLRLVTCGGPFDRGSGHYQDNLVVFAELKE
jgi:sortase (surface protein transpeptidase)